MARLSYSVRRCEAVFGHIEDEHSDDKVGSRGPRQLLLLQPATSDVKTSLWKSVRTSPQFGFDQLQAGARLNCWQARAANIQSGQGFEGGTKFYLKNKDIL